MGATVAIAVLLLEAMTAGIPPVGRCIYCGATDPPLTREHVIPFGLGGNVVLPAASCNECAKATSALERDCLRGMFEIYRARTGYPTRRKKLARDLVHVAATFEDGSTGFLDVPITDYPQMLLLPTFPTARALCGLGHDRGVAIDLGTWGWSDSEQIESFKSKYGLSGFTAVEVDPMKFSRFLARIAFAGAIVRLGPDAFTSIGIDNILGLDPSMNFYVGSGDLVDMAWPEAKLPTHQFKHFFHPDTGVVMMALRLFAHLDPPTYHVIVGHQAGGGIAKIMEQLPPFRKETQHPFPFQVHVNK